MFFIMLNAYFHSYANYISILSINTSVTFKFNTLSDCIGKTRSKQEVIFSDAWQTLVSAGGIVIEKYHMALDQ